MGHNGRDAKDVILRLTREKKQENDAKKFTLHQDETKSVRLLYFLIKIYLFLLTDFLFYLPIFIFFLLSFFLSFFLSYFFLLILLMCL